MTVVMATVAVVIGGFLASAAFAVTAFIFTATTYVVWPIIRPLAKLFLGIVFGILERVWDNLVDIFSDGGIFSKLYEFYTFGGLSASLEMMKPITLVLLTMVLLVRFTLSRRPKNFRKWVMSLFLLCIFLFATHYEMMDALVVIMKVYSLICRICGKELIFQDLNQKLVLMSVFNNYSKELLVFTKCWIRI